MSELEFSSHNGVSERKKSFKYQQSLHTSTNVTKTSLAVYGPLSGAVCLLADIYIVVDSQLQTKNPIPQFSDYKVRFLRITKNLQLQD
jgi:hypothetical protein